jgi:hypothetical protein
MNDDGIFLIIFFCTAAVSGLMSSQSSGIPDARQNAATSICREAPADGTPTGDLPDSAGDRLILER